MATKTCGYLLFRANSTTSSSPSTIPGTITTITTEQESLLLTRVEDSPEDTRRQDDKKSLVHLYLLLSSHHAGLLNAGSGGGLYHTTRWCCISGDPSCQTLLPKDNLDHDQLLILLGESSDASSPPSLDVSTACALSADGSGVKVMNDLHATAFF